MNDTDGCDIQSQCELDRQQRDRKTQDIVSSREDDNNEPTQPSGELFIDAAEPDPSETMQPRTFSSLTTRCSIPR